MSREQIKFTFQIGYPVGCVSFEVDLANAASRLCGGCTTSHKQGWWCADGAEKGRLTFEAPAEIEHTFQLELTCEPHKAEAVYASMCEVIAERAAWHCINTDWVHVSETRMTGRHFSVKAMNAAHVA